MTLTREQGQLAKPRRKKGKVAKPKRQNKTCGCALLRSNSTMQPDRVQARTHERNETTRFPGWTHPQTPIYIYIYIYIYVSFEKCLCFIVAFIIASSPPSGTRLLPERRCFANVGFEKCYLRLWSSREVLDTKLQCLSAQLQKFH